MSDLRGACRPSGLGESGVDEDGTVAEHERQQKVKEFIWARLFIPKNSICSSAEFFILERR